MPAATGPDGVLPLKMVKNGFIHFHNPATVVAQEQKVGMCRSSSWPTLPHVDFEDAQEAQSPCSSDGAESVSVGIRRESFFDFVPRTPSTACPSPWLRSSGMPAAAAEPTSSRVGNSELAVSVQAAVDGSRPSKKSPCRAPFASLMLPDWAMELAAKAPPVEDFSDVRSWYSESPSSTPGVSPQPSSLRLASWLSPIDGEMSQAFGAMDKLRWADVGEHEDDAWPDVPDDVEEISEVGVSSCDTCDIDEDDDERLSQISLQTFCSDELYFMRQQWQVSEDRRCPDGAWHGGGFALQPMLSSGKVAEPAVPHTEQEAAGADSDFFVGMFISTPEWPFRGPSGFVL